APIDGVVLGRLVDVGQTVAASLSAPQLFLIAGDLSKMQILASVDESDIGKVFVGQEASFTVQAHGDRKFTGRVSQIRLQSTMTENVVSYTVVIELDNPNNVLLPGMTATVELVVDKATDVLKVPNAALRFQPTAEMRAQVGNRSDGAGAEGARGRNGRGGESAARNGEGGAPRGGDGSAMRGGNDAPARGGEGTAPGGEGAATRGERSWGRGVLWTVKGGRIEVIPVRTGITDGQ